MTREIIPGGPQHHEMARRTFAAILSLPAVLLIATVMLACVWAVLTLSLIFSLIACAALVAIGLPICVLMARRTRRRKFPPNEP
jgi:Flp pilus assembly protein TadB